MSVAGISPELVEEHGLSLEEYQRIVDSLGREPNLTELGIFSVMWSEHCSYKSSRKHLKKLPTQGSQVIEGPGENAGVIDVGEGLAAVFKIESHNHPSFIEPYQGAATGVGGILRDIFTMGARPVALMNSLHFGPLEHSSNQLIMEGVVAGISGYGNCVGVPTVGGEVHFHTRYAQNPLVNVFCLGIAPADRIFRATASGQGNPVIYVGARTGRDGIHGATMASEEFSEDSETKRPTVQVGDPLMEKLLLEACLEAIETGAIVGIQDMGAAGLTCSTSEMSSKAQVGIQIELDKVPQREPGMSPYEIMLSESQERMLLVAQKGREEEVLQIFRKWDLDAVVIGSVQPGQNLVVLKNGKKEAEVPTLALTDEAPLYDRPVRKPSYLDRLSDWRELEIPEPGDYTSLIQQVISSPHLCSRRWVYEQYDYMVRTNTALIPGGDAAVIRFGKGVSGLAMSLDSNARYCWIAPRKGAALVIAEACRNLVCTGARPLAATNCLNFASPENPEVMWQFVQTVEGMREACEAFDTPITGGNVSFYNETDRSGVPPTPVIGMVGKIEDISHLCTHFFKKEGDLIFVLGENRIELGGSLLLELLGQGPAGPCPGLDLAREKELQELMLTLTGRGILGSAHDVSEGGLLTALLEAAFGPYSAGFSCRIPGEVRPDHFLLSESAGRVLVSLDPEKRDEFLSIIDGFPALSLGRVKNQTVTIETPQQTLFEQTVANLEWIWSSHFDQVFQH